MKKIILYLLIFSSVYAQNVERSSGYLLNGEKYLTGDDGVVRTYVNVWGHVRTPGTYLIYDGADLMAALSLAGGPLIGANLKDVTIISNEDKNSKKYNIKKVINNDEKLSSPTLKPYDTIVVDAKKSYVLFSTTNVASAFVQVLTLVYTIRNID
tara:strand:+ start:1088 stop:1549 length:462 start_codon:yes stop_codon:yes gene_type:complete